MITININCWEEFDSKLQEIKSKYIKCGEADDENSCQVLYRGQFDRKWKLETTLERFGLKEIPFENYLDTTLRCVNPIETFTKNKFDILSKDDLINEFNIKSNNFGLQLPFYDYWIYLRHHGFPSPLLDWTFSPYIAAFFAFSGKKYFKETNTPKKKPRKCSIYVYIGMPKGVRSDAVPGPRIWVFGHETKAHKRHYLQQSWYTLALKAERVIPTIKEYHKHIIVSHEDIFKSSNKDQDLIIRIDIPLTEQQKVLHNLDQHNINHYSLFQSDESLLQALAFKEIY